MTLSLMLQSCARIHLSIGKCTGEGGGCLYSSAVMLTRVIRMSVKMIFDPE